MKNLTQKIVWFSLIAAALLAVPAVSRAQDAGTSTPAAAAKPKHGAPFHGTLGALDTNAMTLTVGSRTFQVTSDTRIMKNDKPAMLADGEVGQPVSGYYKPSDDGSTLNASSVYFGSHATKAKAKKKKAPAPEVTATNAPAAMPAAPTAPPASPVMPPPPPAPPMTGTNGATGP